jgi:hypothetical protein
MSSITLPSNISSNVFLTPTNVENAVGNKIFTVTPNPQAIAPSEKRFCLVTSIVFCNKTNNNIEINAKIVNGVTSARFLNEVVIPPGTAFEVVEGNKFILKEGDEMFIWHNSTTLDVIDVIFSYTLHDPLTPYQI